MQSADLAKQVILGAERRGWRIATAESCTAGLVCGALTTVSGSSSVIEGGFVTYSNEAKRDLLGVDWDLIMSKGAVSAEVAKAMAAGTLERMGGRAHLSVSVTGIAGPNGGTDDKPVGLVWFGIACNEDGNPVSVRSEKRLFEDNGRDDIRSAAVTHALQLLLNAISWRNPHPHTGPEPGQ